MSFQLPGAETWTFQIVICGSLLLLEGLSGDLCCSAWLNPLESPRRLAYQLVNQPQCVLR